MNRSSRRLLARVTQILGAFYATSSLAAPESLAICQQTYSELRNRAENVEELIENWIASEADCKGTGFYEYELSELYIRNRDYGKSNEVIEKGLGYKTSFDKELLFARGNVFLHQKDYAAAESAYKVVTEMYPDWNIGFDYLGFTVFAQGQNPRAVEILNRANRLKETADSYRTLTLAHHLLGNHEQAVDSLNRAYSLDEDILADRDPMVAGIRSYADIGKFDVSQQLLALLLNKNPEIRTDNEFLKAGFYLRQKMVDAGLIVE